MADLMVKEYQGVDKLSGNQWSYYGKLKKLFKSKVLKNELKELEAIIKKYHPEYTKEDILAFAREINQSGCTLVAAASTILESLNYDSVKFNEVFDFPLYKKDGSINHDYLIVELAAFFQDKVEIEVRGHHEVLQFANNIEAAESILGVTYGTEEEAFIELTRSNCLIDGHTYKYFEKKPATYIGDYKEIGMQLFNQKFNSFEELKQAFKDNNMAVLIKGDSIPSKLSTLDEHSYIKWMDLYFKSKGLDLRVISESARYKSYDDMIMALEEAKELGNSITVEVAPSSKAAMTDGTKFGWFNFESVKGVGHAMPFKGININGDIVVSSWGQYQVIPKQYYSDLEFYKRRMYTINKEKDEVKEEVLEDTINQDKYYQNIINSINQKIEYLNAQSNLNSFENIHQILTDEELSLMNFIEVSFKDNNGGFAPTMVVVVSYEDYVDYRLLYNNGNLVRVSKDYLQSLIDMGQLIDNGSIPGVNQLNR